ncbi:MAG: S8 family serine peptidase [Candidatus Latescibacterota bacterium]
MSGEGGGTLAAFRPAYSSPFADHALRLVEPVEPLESITSEWAWGGSTGQGVRVAVVDSGIDARHPAVGRVDGYMAISEGPDGLVYDAQPHEDLYGHGTACAGIIRSLAPDCELYSVRVLGPSLTGQGAVFVAGLRWAIEQGMHVCNLSLSTAKKELYGVLHELADLAYFRRVALVSAANNLAVPSYPSVYASVISVGSHQVQDPYHFYYNPEPPVEFGALGIDVRVAWLDGGWVTTTGNSFAAPHIAGIVTCILAKHPGLVVFQLKAILRALAVNVGRRPRRGSPGRVWVG